MREQHYSSPPPCFDRRKVLRRTDSAFLETTEQSAGRGAKCRLSNRHDANRNVVRLYGAVSKGQPGLGQTQEWLRLNSIKSSLQ